MNIIIMINTITALLLCYYYSRYSPGQRQGQTGRASYVLLLLLLILGYTNRYINPTAIGRAAISILNIIAITEGATKPISVQD